MNPGKLEMIKQEMARVNVKILEISELKWAGMGEFNSDDHYIYHCGQESLRRNGIVSRSKKSLKSSTWMQSQNDRMSSVHFQCKLFNMIIIRDYAPTTDTKQAEVEWFYGDPQDLLKLTPKERCPFHHRKLECKSRKSRDTWSNRHVWPWSTK